MSATDCPVHADLVRRVEELADLARQAIDLLDVLCGPYRGRDTVAVLRARLDRWRLGGMGGPDAAAETGES